MGKKKLTPEEQYNVMLEHFQDRVPIVDLAKKYRVSEQTLHAYKNKFLHGAKNSLAGLTNVNGQALRRQNARCSKLASRLLKEIEKIALLSNEENH